MAIAKFQRWRSAHGSTDNCNTSLQYRMAAAFRWDRRRLRPGDIETTYGDLIATGGTSSSISDPHGSSDAMGGPDQRYWFIDSGRNHGGSRCTMQLWHRFSCRWKILRPAPHPTMVRRQAYIRRRLGSEIGNRPRAFANWTAHFALCPTQPGTRSTFDSICCLSSTRLEVHTSTGNWSGPDPTGIERLLVYRRPTLHQGHKAFGIVTNGTSTSVPSGGMTAIRPARNTSPPRICTTEIALCYL